MEGETTEGTPPEPTAATSEEPVAAPAPETEADSAVAAAEAAAASAAAALAESLVTPLALAPAAPVVNSRVVQITNIAPQATRDQMMSLFVHVGQIEDIRLYPSVRDASVTLSSRCCFIKFTDDAAVAISQHMNNTVFIDRAIIVSLVPSGEVPDEYTGMTMAQQRPGFSGREQQEVKMPPNMLNRIEGVAPNAQARPS